MALLLAVPALGLPATALAGNPHGQPPGHAPSAPAVASVPSGPGNGHGNGHAYGHGNGQGAAHGNGNGNGHGASVPVAAPAGATTAPAPAPSAPAPSRHVAGATPTAAPATVQTKPGHGCGRKCLDALQAAPAAQPSAAAPAPAPTPRATPAPAAKPSIRAHRRQAASSTSARSARRAAGTAAGRLTSGRTSAARAGGAPAAGAAPGGGGALSAGGVLGPGLTGSGTGPARATTFPTAPAAAARGGASRRSGATPGQRRTRRGHVRDFSPATLTSDAGVIISRFVQVIPAWLWVALAGALAAALIGGIGGILSARRAHRQQQSLVAISAAALTDSLTGVLNRRGFVEAAERELARAQRYGRPFAIAYVDIRGLKAVNDSQGHLAGDELLRQAARLLSESARADDVVGRLGGDELGLLLVEQTLEGAAAVTTRIHDELPARRAQLGLAAPWDITIGTAAFPEDGEELDELLRVADRRLYEQRGITLR